MKIVENFRLGYEKFSDIRGWSKIWYGIFKIILNRKYKNSVSTLNHVILYIYKGHVLGSETASVWWTPKSPTGHPSTFTRCRNVRMLCSGWIPPPQRRRRTKRFTTYSGYFWWVPPARLRCVQVPRCVPSLDCPRGVSAAWAAATR